MRAEKEKSREGDRAREAVRQKNFFANYNDERDDSKFYKYAQIVLSYIRFVTIATQSDHAGGAEAGAGA